MKFLYYNTNISKTRNYNIIIKIISKGHESWEDQIFNRRKKHGEKTQPENIVQIFYKLSKI